MRSPSLAPSSGPDHIVLCDFGRLGLAWREIEPNTSELQVVEGIISGQFDKPVRVVAFDPAEGWSRDVSEDVAVAIAERARKNEIDLGKGAREFVEQHHEGVL